MKINNFRGDLTVVSAEKEALPKVPVRLTVVWRFAGISGPILDRTRAYKQIMAGCLTITLPCLVLFVVIAHKHDMIGILYMVSALLGFFAFPLLPTCLDASVEVRTLPV